MGNLPDANGKPIDLVDYKATEIVGVQIGAQGHKLWICIDGVAVLRVTSPQIELTDMRQKELLTTENTDHETNRQAAKPN